MNSSPAYAYLDPGTGSIIVQSIIGLVAAGAAAIGLYWAKVKTILNGLFRLRSADDDNSD
jgi:hypothetical protein